MIANSSNCLISPGSLASIVEGDSMINGTTLHTESPDYLLCLSLLCIRLGGLSRRRGLKRNFTFTYYKHLGASISNGLTTWPIFPSERLSIVLKILKFTIGSVTTKAPGLLLRPTLVSPFILLSSDG